MNPIHEEEEEEIRNKGQQEQKILIADVDQSQNCITKSVEVDTVKSQ